MPALKIETNADGAASRYVFGEHVHPLLPPCTRFFDTQAAAEDVIRALGRVPSWVGLQASYCSFGWYVTHPPYREVLGSDGSWFPWPE